MDENENPFALLNRENTAEQAEPGTGSVLVGSGDHPDRTEPHEAGGLFGAPSTPVDGSWSFSTSKARGGFPKVRLPIALALVVVLLAGVGSYLFLSRRSSSGGTAFALSLSRNKSYRYAVHMGMQGTMSMQGQQQPLNMQMDQTISWRVESVDGDGTATVAVTTEIANGQMNGEPMPAMPPQTTRIRVAKDGRMLSMGNLTLTSATDFGSFMPGTDQFMPLLPDHPVDVGDSWTKKFDQDLPFGMGSLQYEVASSLLRYETVDGSRTAVIFSTLSLPLDMAIDLKKVLTATGGDAGGDAIPGNPKMQFGGTMTMQQTAWFDQARGELSRTSATATFDMTVEFKDFPQSTTPTGEIGFDGTMNMEVQRLDSKSKLTEEQLRAQRAAQDKEAQSDLRNALVAAKVHFTESSSYAGFTPAVADKIEPTLTYNRSAKAKTGQVSIRLAGKNAILLVIRSASGRMFCVADQVGRKIAYGKRDAKTVASCRGGW
jgi:hypothetical protein